MGKYILGLLHGAWLTCAIIGLWCHFSPTENWAPGLVVSAFLVLFFTGMAYDCGAFE